MSYIGKQPTVGNFQICDAISVVNNQAAYTMQVGSVNVIPETANHMIVSLNGVIQKPGGANPSFTVSGSTITFASNLVTGDVINFIQILGSVLDVGTVSDATITNAKTNFVSTSSAAGLQIKGDGTTDGTLQLNCSQNSHGIKIKSPPHSASASYTLTMPNNDGDANQVLTTNGSGVLSFAAAGGITMADQWRITTTFTGNANTIASNWEQVDSAARLQGTLGSAMSQSSGIFTFPATGIYLVTFNTNYAINGNERSVTAWINAATDNSNYYATAYKSAFIQQTDSNWTASSAVTQALVDVQDTSNDKVKFEISVQNSNTQTQGSTNETVTGVTFIRLGDT